MMQQQQLLKLHLLQTYYIVNVIILTITTVFSLSYMHLHFLHQHQLLKIHYVLLN